MMILRAGFKENGGGNMQEYSDNYSHHFIEVLFDIAEVSGTDTFAQ